MREDRFRTPRLPPQEPHEPQQQRQQERQWPAPVPLPGAAYPDWEAIYADNVGRIYRLMFSKVGNRPDAEDLTSQVFLTAYGPLRATAGVAQVRAYLTATARTVLAEHWRRTLGHQVTEIHLETTDLENYGGTGTGPGGGTGRGEVGTEAGSGVGAAPGATAPGTDDGSTADERAARILEALPQRQRQILVLRFLRGYTIRQAAAELGVTVANAKVLQHRALKAAARMEDTQADGREHVDGVERVGSAERIDRVERASGVRRVDGVGRMNQVGRKREQDKKEEA